MSTQIKSEPKPPFPAQKQVPPGREDLLNPQPRFEARNYLAAGKLKGKSALITGGDSGIGRAVAVLFAREGADVAISYLPEEEDDAQVTAYHVEALGRECLLVPGDLTDPKYCAELVEKTVNELGSLNILVSNAAHQMRKSSLDELTLEEWDRTFKTNVYAYFLLAKAAVPHMHSGDAIIVTSSETAYIGPKELPDYSASKGAINSFTRSLAKQLIDKGIRVNAVAPGPVWTPLNPSDAGTDANKVRDFGKDQPIGRPAQPEELAPLYVFLASEADSSYVTGAIVAETGGLSIN